MKLKEIINNELKEEIKCRTSLLGASLAGATLGIGLIYLTTKYYDPIQKLADFISKYI